MEFVTTILIAVLLAFGSWRVSAAILYHDRYSTGKKNLQQIGKWYKEKQEFWDSPLFRKATRFLTRFVYLDDTARDSLRRQLHRAGMDITPEQFTARKYVIYGDREYIKKESYYTVLLNIRCHHFSSGSADLSISAVV